MQTSSFTLVSPCLTGLLLLCAAACSDPKESVVVELPVHVDASALETTETDLGYAVELSEARIMVKDLTFAMAGEAHTASLLRETYDWLIPTSFAHPGHFQGGDITGELRGRFLLDWLPGKSQDVGQATLLEGKYTNANFIFIRASDDDVGPDDELLSHTAILRGSADKGDRSIEFLALIDSPDDRPLTGVPFEFEVKASSPRAELHLFLELRDPLEGDSLFDGLDFLALDEDDDGQVSILPESDDATLSDAYNLLRRTLQTHDNYEVRAIIPEEGN